MGKEYKLDRVGIVTSVLCAHLGVDFTELKEILKKKENKYLFLLLLKKYKCLDSEKIKEIIEYASERSIKYNINRAEEKLLVNKEFREVYFEIEDGLNKGNNNPISR
jgi:DNA topoisomerase VI subunit B